MKSEIASGKDADFVAFAKAVVIQARTNRGIEP